MGRRQAGPPARRGSAGAAPPLLPSPSVLCPFRSYAPRVLLNGAPCCCARLQATQRPAAAFASKQRSVLLLCSTPSRCRAPMHAPPASHLPRRPKCSSWCTPTASPPAKCSRLHIRVNRLDSRRRWALVCPACSARSCATCRRGCSAAQAVVPARPLLMQPHACAIAASVLPQCAHRLWTQAAQQSNHVDRHGARGARCLGVFGALLEGCRVGRRQNTHCPSAAWVFGASLEACRQEGA